MVCLGILVFATAVLRAVRPGSIYYWLKDITSEFLKMSVLSTAFDISDKILSNFGNDVLEALSGTCTQVLAGKRPPGAVVSDAVVAAAVVTLHALTLMCQALVLAVALNSSRNGLVALLIANNFVEIKSTVFKKWDSTRIWALVCAAAAHTSVLLATAFSVDAAAAAMGTPATSAAAGAPAALLPGVGPGPGAGQSAAAVAAGLPAPHASPAGGGSDGGAPPARSSGSISRRLSQGCLSGGTGGPVHGLRTGMAMLMSSLGGPGPRIKEE
ncbi:Protein TAPT1 [Tetrabaena socialis]|uniref:Protein TAPT1 n=1 Tax=Tetrabaena socialis TaxID=47790 RepID=A0A2J8AG91_9CHLO|nr:Protein TAPT1 [Tetrabaena socialis]|eukprot:PNH11543.1 Protein TAPT1 [Tetrabaena socialis]